MRYSFYTVSQWLAFSFYSYFNWERNMRDWKHDKPIFIRKLFNRVENLDVDQCLLFFTNALSAYTSTYEDDLHSTEDKAQRWAKKTFYTERYAPLLEYASKCLIDTTLDLRPLHDAIIHELLCDYYFDGLRQYETQRVLELIIHDTKIDITLWKKLLWDCDYQERFDELDTRASEEL